MEDRKKFVKDMYDFFDSEDSKALVTGLDDDEKIKYLLSILNEKYSEGTIYFNTLGNGIDLLNRAFGIKNKVFPRSITLKSIFQLGKMKLKFDKYSHRSHRFSISEYDDFAVFFPIQIALMEGQEKNFQILTDNISKSKALKTIIVTTNDHYLDTSKLYPFIDRHIHFECKNDNIELYETVKGNLNSRSRQNNNINPIYNNFED